jgi:rubredoxin/uncharacterized membrane protein
MKKWKCSVCGYIHTGEEPPEKCPVCGADKSKFILLEPETEETQPKVDNKEEKIKAPTVENSNSDKNTEKTFTTYTIVEHFPKLTQHMTKYHAHPVSVHIPNGVLPLSVLFTFMAAIFNSEAFATAACINMTFVFFSMPLVLFSGYIDWINRYGGNMTKIFRIKMICGGFVTGLTFLLTIWWLIEPDVLLKESGSSALFMLLHILTLIPAVIAGFYGGKLVFVE